MDRVKDNNKNISDLLDLLTIGGANLESVKVSILADISQSLAIIADNSDYLNPFYGLCKEDHDEYGLRGEDSNG